MGSKVSERTRGLVVINPNNPTGAVYEAAMVKALADFAGQHGLVLFADEIYDRILYDGAVHVPLASVTEETLVLTFGGLSKNYRAAGFRTGWMVCSGNLRSARDYLEGLEILASMRLCANVPTQHAVQGALGGYQSINDLVCPGGALYEQRTLAHEALIALPGVSCVKPLGGLYLFPRLDPALYPIEDDEKFVLDLLLEEKLLLVQGTAFNLPDRQHQRWVFLPRQEELRDALGRFERFLARHRR
jgi:alanine-synthesizing transaminase